MTLVNHDYENRIDNFKNNLLNAIRICNLELANRKNGINGESTVEQLEEIIIPELNQILCMIDSNQLPSKEERYLKSFADAFKVWGWNMQMPSNIFVLLVKINNAYKDL